MKFLKKHSKFFSLIFFLGLTSLILYNISPEKIVERIGVENGYLISFIVAFLGGVSNFINFPYQLVLFSFGAGGLNPIFLGLSSGLGEFLGDSVSYLIGYHGHYILPSTTQKTFRRFSNWCIKGPSWLTSIALFLYGSFIPLPNDLIIFPLALGQFPYLRIMIPLALGNIVFNTLAAYLGWYSYNQ
jgi:membrane protein YqaA with SNARE-associated domain